MKNDIKKELLPADLYYEFSRSYEDLDEVPSWVFYDNIGCEEIYLYDDRGELYIDLYEGKYIINFYNSYNDKLEVYEYNVDEIPNLFNKIEDILYYTEEYISNAI